MKKQTIEITQPARVVTLEFPEGFEATGEFRVPENDEWYIRDGHTATRHPVYASTGYRLTDPRYILRKIEPEIRTGWINAYPERICDTIFTTKSDADSYANPRRVACVEIKYEVPVA